MATLVDLSNNNPRASLVALRAQGVRGIYHKASEGDHFVDSYFAGRRKAARRLLLPFGAYHFARPASGNAQREAEHFCRIVHPLTRSDLRPVLDLETNDRHLTAAQLVAWAREWNHYVVGILGVWPLFYSYPSFLSQLSPATPIGFGLWLADYGPNDGRRHAPRIPVPYRKAMLHQYTSRGRRRGVAGAIDLNYAPTLRPLKARRVG